MDFEEKRNKLTKEINDADAIHDMPGVENKVPSYDAWLEQIGGTIPAEYADLLARAERDSRVRYAYLQFLKK